MKISFLGRVLPIETPAYLDRHKAVVAYRDMPGTVTISYSVSKSNVTAQAEYDESFIAGEFCDIDSMTGIVENIIQSELNVLNILHGTYCTVKLNKFNQNQQWHPTSNIIRCINEREDETRRENKLDRINNLLSSQNYVAQVYLIPIFSDMNKAMRYPTDTGFFCFRAIEIMANYFCESMSATVKPRHVTSLLKALDVERSDYEFVKKYADPVRHGNVIPISPKVKVRLFDITWNFLDSFIIFAENGFSEIISSYEKDQKRKISS